MKSVNVLLIFEKKIMYKPIIYRLVRDYDMVFNVLEAKIYPKQEGRIILEIRGSRSLLDTALDYLKQEGVIVEVLADRIMRREDRCTHCGACTTLCSVDALVIERVTMEVAFHPDRCIACGLCLKACPFHAMSGTSIDAVR
jgi:L-aspartate semialdehyde sulfurtransferase ferredoxin